MTTFVLCHGGWSGGWQWQEVASLLRSAGQEVFTPTFTGLGERVHLASPEVDLDTYIQDILMVLKYENLSDVVLLGYSISGPVISGVAEKAVERISHLVYLDAYVLEDGQSLADQVGAEIMAGLQEAARMYGEGWRLPHDPPDAVAHWGDCAAPPGSLSVRARCWEESVPRRSRNGWVARRFSI